MNYGSLSDLEATLKQRVKKVLKCDVRLENPFYPHTLEPADCVITSLCLEAACKDIQTYCRALHGLTEPLRPGGLLVMIGVLGERFYKVDEQLFSCLRLSRDNIEEALRGLGLSPRSLICYLQKTERTTLCLTLRPFFIL